MPPTSWPTCVLNTYINRRVFENEIYILHSRGTEREANKLRGRDGIEKEW